MNKNFRRFLDKSSLKLKEVSPGILTALSIAGLIGTVALTIRATLKTNDILKKVEKEKGEKLTILETVQVSARPCAPAIVAGLGTSILMFSSHQISKMQIATLTAGYAALNQNYKKYMAKTKELLGEDGCKKIREAIVKDEVKRQQPSQPQDDKLLYFEEHRGEFFEVTEADVIRAEYEVNKRMSEVGYVSLNFFYNAMGLKPTDDGDELGWNFDQLMAGTREFEGDIFCWVDFQHEKFDLEDGMEAINIIFPYPPMKDYMLFEWR